jgi:hypothetical protein
MKKARLEDGQVVLAHQYNKAAHGDRLRCADPDCNAPMVYRREALTHGAAALRSASFVSKSVSDHIANCTAHEDFAIMAKQKKSIEQALREGKTVVLNLNMRLMEDFNAAALPQDMIGVASTGEKYDYVTAAVKSVEDFLDLMTMIETKAGQKGLDKTVVNYKGKTLPIMEFVVDTRDKYRDLLNKMYKSVDSAKDRRDVTDFPRLINFRATQNTKQRETGAIRGTPMTFLKGKGNRLVLLQKAQVEKDFQQTLRGENVFVIAQPTLNYGEAQAVLRKLQTQSEQTVFLNLNWQVVGAHQFTPVEEQTPDSPKPKTQPGQQSLFKF